MTKNEFVSKINKDRKFWGKKNYEVIKIGDFCDLVDMLLL